MVSVSKISSNILFCLQLLTYRRNPGISYMFTIPKDMIDSVMKSLSPVSSQRSQGQGHIQGQDPTDTQGHVKGEGENLDWARTRHSSNRENFQRQLVYNEQPEYVSPDSDNQQFSRYQALESRNPGYQTRDAINRLHKGYNDNAGKNFDSNSLVTNVYDAIKPQYKGFDEYKGSDVGYDQRVNTIPDGAFDQSFYPQSGSGGGAYQTYRNSVEPQKPLLTVPNTVDEVNFHWVISGFTDCSATCGGGQYQWEIMLFFNMFFISKVFCMLQKVSNVMKFVAQSSRHFDIFDAFFHSKNPILTRLRSASVVLLFDI